MKRQYVMVDRTDPNIAAFLTEAEGKAKTPVAIKLTGETLDDLKIQIKRLERAFGSLVVFTAPQRVSDGVTWIVHGTMIA